jgi:hypothetical protein
VRKESMESVYVYDIVQYWGAFDGDKVVGAKSEIEYVIKTLAPYNKLI